MAGTRYGHKLKARINKGKSFLTTKKGGAKTDFHIYSQEGHISIDELADIFFTTVEKIKKARKLGIINAVNDEKRAKKYFFHRAEAIKALSKFKDKNGFLSI